MKKLVFPAVAALILGLGASCTTMYDSYGRPTEVITPEGAAVTALAAGVIGYAIADNNRSYYRGHGGHYGHGHGGYGHGGYGYGGYGGRGYRR